MVKPLAEAAELRHPLLPRQLPQLLIQPGDRFSVIQILITVFLFEFVKSVALCFMFKPFLLFQSGLKLLFLIKFKEGFY